MAIGPPKIDPPAQKAAAPHGQNPAVAGERGPFGPRISARRRAPRSRPARWRPGSSISMPSSASPGCLWSMSVSTSAKNFGRAATPPREDLSIRRFATACSTTAESHPARAARRRRKRPEGNQKLARARFLVDLRPGGGDFPDSGPPESLICEIVSNAIDKGWLSIMRDARKWMPL
jgi:hypothetical protein